MTGWLFKESHQEGAFHVQVRSQREETVALIKGDDGSQLVT